MEQWDVGRHKLADFTPKEKATLKIVLKTRNEQYLIEKWIRHHSNIVGLSNITIFDNMSDIDYISSIYKAYEPDIRIFLFDGFLDNLHRVNLYPDLYQWLRQSSVYYLFIDTDEYLVCFDGDKFISNAEILEFLPKHNSCVPTATLTNYPGCESRYFFSRERFGDSIRWGKPIISSAFDVDGFINHNIQIGLNAFSTQFPGNFFLLHMNQVTPVQRIHANIQKLKAFGLTVTESFECDCDWSDPKYVGALKYAKELRDLLKIGSTFPSPPRHLSPGTIGLSEGLIEFSSGDQHDFLCEYLKHPQGFFEQTFL